MRLEYSASSTSPLLYMPLQVEDTVSDDERFDDEDASGMCQPFCVRLQVYCLLFSQGKLGQEYVIEDTGDSPKNLRY